MFLIGYGVLRFIAEFFRQPDNFLGLLAFNLTMGQWLSLPMIIVGIVMLAWALRKV
jgi:phosphatidylglycerol:prolipoprotein diacylglycerol transferase